MDNKIMKDKIIEYKNEENFRFVSTIIIQNRCDFNESYIMLNKILVLSKKIKNIF